jgi:vitamin B12 transporter
LGSSAVAQGTVALPTIDVVSATTIPTQSSQLASSVTVITGADLMRDQRRTVPDALMAVPGLNVVQNGSPGTQTSVFIRGTNSNHVKVLVDGIDIGDSSTPSGAFDFGHLTTLDIDRIEILRGPQSGLYGADAIGGVISITTKKGEGPAKVTALIEGGSFGTFNQAASLSGSYDRFNYAFNVSHFRADSTPVTPPYMVPAGGNAIPNFYDNWTYSTRLGVDLTEYLAVNFYGRYTTAKLLYSNDDPAAFPGKTLPNRSTYDNDTLTGRGEVVWKLLDGRFTNVFGAAHSNYQRSNFDPDLASRTTFDGTRDKLDWRGTFLAMPGQTIVMGLERQNDRATTDNLDAKTGNTGGFIELQSEFNKRVFLVANVRHDRHDDFGDHTTYRLAPALILPITETTVKATYGTGFKAPSLYQLYGNGPFGFMGNPNLRPEESIGYDFGFEQPIWDNRIRFGATYYHNGIKNLIDFNNTFTTVVNINEATIHGAEAFVAFSILENLRTRFDYTRTIALDAITGLELLRRPRDKYSWNTVWQPIAPLTLSATLIYLGQWRDIDRATFVFKTAGNVATVNVAASYAVNNQVTVFVRGDNLFDRKYENPLGWMQPGLAVYGGVKFASR